MNLRDVDRVVTPPVPNLAAIWSNWELTTVLPYFQRSTSVNAIGAMGTNRVGVPIGNDVNGNPVNNTVLPYGYYSIYNQRHSSKWIGNGLANRDLTALDTGIRALEYAIAFQDYQGKALFNLTGSDFVKATLYSDGRFPAVATALTSATIFDVLGNMSFFLCDAQLTLHSLRSSDWFQTDSTTAKLKARVTRLEPYLKIAIDWLGAPFNTSQTGNLPRWRYLLNNDTINPNRILQQGSAHYGMGVYFNDKRLMNLGRYIIDYALQFQINGYTDAIRPITGIVTKNGYTDKPYMAWARTLDYLQAAPLGWGWFAETGGSDTSYNDSNILFLLRSWVVMPTWDKEFRDRCWLAILRAFRWQMRLFLSTGSVSLQDNTRVYNGGENYQGKPKTVDYLEWLFVLNFMRGITGDKTLDSPASLLFSFFTLRSFTINAQLDLYTYGRSLVLDGTIDPATIPLHLSLVMVSGTTTANGVAYAVNLATHKFLSEIDSRSFFDTQEILDQITYDPATGILTSEPLFYEALQPKLPSRQQIGAVILWADTGDPTTSPLLAYTANVTGLPYGPQGTDLQLAFATGNRVTTFV